MSQNSAEVVLVFPPGGDVPFSSFSPCLGNAYIAAYLNSRGVSAHIFNSVIPLTATETVQQILKKKPLLVGFTAFNTNYVSCCLLAREIKKHRPEIPVIFGGPMATVLSKEIIEENKSVDVCVRGEGEEVLFDIIERIRKASKLKYKFDKYILHSINGLTYKNGNDVIFTPPSNCLRREVKNNSNIDNYPSPYLSGTIEPKHATHLGIITARGCNQNCTYCNCAVLSDRKIFPHSVDRVISELNLISSLDDFDRPVPIQDDAFTLIPNRAETICERIISNKIKVPLSALVRCDQVTEQLLVLMRNAGFQSIGFSLESSTPRVLRNIGKVSPPKSRKDETFSREQYYIDCLGKNVKFAKELGFKPVFISVMVGLPGETRSEAINTIEYVKSLAVDMYMHNLFTIYPGTPIFNEHQSFGYEIEYLGNSKLFPTTKHTFNVRREIPFAESSNYKRTGILKDLTTMRKISLDTQNKTTFGFNSVIIMEDKLTSSVIRWLQENLVVNGNIIQIYSSKNAMTKNNRADAVSLTAYSSPSLNYEPYYVYSDLDIKHIISNRTVESGNEDLGIKIKLATTSYWYNNLDSDYEWANTVCVERSEEDVIFLINHLKSIQSKKGAVSSLSNAPFLPYFQGLCRWLKKSANCIAGDIAIIGPGDNIRLCWQGENLANFSNSYSEIMDMSLKRLECEKIRRGCSTCSAKEYCISCIYTAPLSSEDYCILRKSYNLNPSILTIKAFDELKMKLYRQ